MILRTVLLCGKIILSTSSFYYVIEITRQKLDKEIYV